MRQPDAERRLEVRIGRGIFPTELAFYGIKDESEARQRFEETLSLLLGRSRSRRCGVASLLPARTDPASDVQTLVFGRARRGSEQDLLACAAMRR
jgi:hypothetical protein